MAILLSAAPAAAAVVSLTGTVADESGAGISGVQINFVDSCTGVTATATGNTTSSTGTFLAVVGPGVYDVEFMPPGLPSLFTAYRLRNFDLTASRSLPALNCPQVPAPPSTLCLSHGIIVSGRVTDASGAGASGVFVHFQPPGSSERVFTVRDKTDLSGNYSVVVAPGTYDVKYGPPLGTRYLGSVSPAVPIPLNATLPTVALSSGLLVSGTVYDTAGAGRPVINVNLDAIDVVSGEKIFLSHDRTDATGAYSIAVPPGTYLLDYKPQRCTSLVGVESAPTAVTADVALARVSLPSGVLVKGVVTDVRGAPVFDVNTNYISAATGVQIFTFDDHSDAAGAYSAVVPPDVYNIEYAPPAGVRLAGVKRYAVDIRNATTLAPVALPDGAVVSGRTVRVSGEPLAGIDLDFFDLSASGSPKIYTPHDLSDASGIFAVVVIPGSYDLRFEPPSSAPLAAKRLKDLALGGDVALGNVVIERGLVVSGRVTDVLGSPIANLETQPPSTVDLDFFDAYTHDKAETLHDNTDPLTGTYSVIVPARLYNVIFSPPAGAAVETGRVAGVAVTSSISGLDIVLGGAALVSGRVRDSFSQGIGGVDLDFFHSGSGIPQTVSRDKTVTDGSGTFGVYVPAGTYDIVFTPPAAYGLAEARVNGVAVLADVDIGDILLGNALLPALASISPASGPSTGGNGVTILGSGFQEGVGVTLGGLDLLSVRVVSPGQISATTPACPLGPSGAIVDLAVTNIGAPTVTLAGAYTCTPPALPISLSISRTSPSIILTWPSTGQPFYTVYRSTSPGLFGQAQVLTVTSAATFTDVGADGDGANYFYRVE